jgi:hypothetical protein
MKKLLAAVVVVFGFANVSHATWNDFSENALEMQLAKHNAVYDLAKYIGEQTGQELKSDDYVADVKLVSSTVGKDGEDSLPAIFEVTLHSRNKDGSVSTDSVGAQLTCARGNTRQEGRFTRVTPIHCTIIR